MTNPNDKLILKNVILFVLGLYLMIENSYYQNFRLYFAFAGLIITFRSVFLLPVSVARKFVNYYNYISLSGILTTFIIAFLTIYLWFGHNKNRLIKYGVEKKAIVISRKWLGNRSAGFQITYSFQFDNELFLKKTMNQKLVFGDTVLIKCDPVKPINNELLEDL